ncbi:MAG: DUF3078 domain-containing protein [Prevotella sp.]|jgi:hypothetical protein
MNKYRFVSIFLTVFLLFPSLARGQRHYQPTRYSTPLRSPIANYQDSLKAFGDSLFREDVRVPSTLSSQDVAPLFLPLTFYKRISHNAFVMDKTLSPLDEQLLSVYLHRPDMVQATQSELEAAGPTLAPKTVTDEPTALVQQPSAKEPEALPVDLVVLKPNFWSYSGDYYLQFMQNYISGNWHKGGESNQSMEGYLSLNANYNNKSKFKWENRLEMKLGFQTTKGDTLHKFRPFSDMLRYTGKIGLQASKRWYYTLQVVANTQFMRNYETNRDHVLSDFASPLNLNISLGMDYEVDWFKGKLRGKIHLAPLAYNLRYVGRLALSTRYGLEEGKHTLHDYGSQMTVDMRWKFTDNILWQTRLYGYTTYERAEIEWENTFTFHFNKYVSAKVFVYPRFDDATKRDDHHGYWQFKENISLGFSYEF